MNNSLTLKKIEDNFPHTKKVEDLISNIFSIINIYEENAYCHIDKYIANFRRKNLVVENNFSAIDYSNEIKKIIDDGYLDEKELKKNNPNLSYEKFFMGLVDVDSSQIKDLFIDNNYNFNLKISESDTDFLVYSKEFESKIVAALDFSQDNRKHELLSICSVFIEKMDETSLAKFKSDIENETFNEEEFLRQIHDLSIIPFNITKDEKTGKLTYAISASGLPDAMFFQPGYASLSKLNVITVAATLDKGTNVEGNSMLRHTVSSLMAKKEINNMLKDRSYNKAYDKIMTIYDHFDKNDSDFIMNEDESLLLGLEAINPSLLAKTHVSKKDWDDEIKYALDELINHDGKLMNFSIDYLNQSNDKSSNHDISEFDFADSYAKHLDFKSWESYIKQRSSSKSFIDNMKELHYKEEKNNRRITKKDFKKLSRDMKLNGLDTFYVGNAAFNEKNKTTYYKDVESELDLSPVELRVGMNVAAYASEYSGYLDFCEIEPGAGLEFVSSFNIRANTKSGDIDGKKVYNSMPKIHQLMLNEYVFASYENIVDNDEKESEYILENIAKFKSSFYISIQNLMENYDLDPDEAFKRYTNELGAEMPIDPKFDINEFLKKEKELIENGVGKPSLYSMSFKLLDAYVKINKMDKLISEKDKLFVEKDKSLVEKDKSLVEKDKSLVEKDKSLVEKDNIIDNKNIMILNNSLAFGVKNCISPDDKELLQIFKRIESGEPILDGRVNIITSEIYKKYTAAKKKVNVKINEDDFSFLNNNKVDGKNKPKNKTPKSPKNK